MPRRDPTILLEDMAEHAQKAIDFASGRTRESLDDDEMLALSIVRLLEVLGEAAAQVPDEFKQRYPQVPWRDLTDFRNVLIHAYHRVDHALVWEVVATQLRPLIDQVRNIVQLERSDDS